jgi:acetyl-CoA carboxylase biotin carboxyl carrier protein
MQLDHDQLHKLLAILGESDIQELKLEGDDFRLEVRRNLPGAAPVAMPQAPVAVAAGPAAVAPQPLAATAPSLPPPAAASARTDLLEITAPMVATFYRSPTPDDPAFVEVGSRIGVGQTVCILEAMKLMNELESELAGEVVEILVENGTPVEYGQVLLRLRPL